MKADSKKNIVKIYATTDINGNVVRKCFLKDGTHFYTRQSELFRIGEYDKWYKNLKSLYQAK